MDVAPTINSVHGRIFSHTGTDPAAGANISETVPDRRRWKIMGFRFPFVTDVNVADRVIKILIDDGTNVLIELRLATAQAASLTYYYSFAPSPTLEFRVGTYVFVPLPSLTLGPGFRIRTVTTLLQVGDDYGAPQFLIEEWIDP